MPLDQCDDRMIFVQGHLADDPVPQPVRRGRRVVPIMPVLPGLGEPIEHAGHLHQDPVCPTGSEAGVGSQELLQPRAFVRPIRRQPANRPPRDDMDSRARLAQERRILQRPLPPADDDDLRSPETA